MSVAVDHVILLQISDLTLVRRHISIGFCPENAKVQMAFVESGEFAISAVCRDHVMVVMVTVMFRTCVRICGGDIVVAMAV